MVKVYCDNEECDGTEMELTDEDGSRDEWYEAVYECPNCERKKVHRKEYDQNGLVVSDNLEEE